MSDRHYWTNDAFLGVAASTDRKEKRLGWNAPDWETYNRARGVLEEKGFRFGPNPRVHAHHRCISRYHHQGRCGDLFVQSEVYPTGCRFVFFQEIVTANPNGGRYDFDREAKMPYLVRKKYQASLAALKRHLDARGFIESRKTPSPYPDPLAYFNDGWDGEYERSRGIHRFARDETGWPGEKELACWPRTDGTGQRVTHGDVRYFRDRKGYLMRGRCFGGINGMWLVVYGGDSWTHKHVSELFLCDPATTARKVHPSPRPLAHVLKEAVTRQDFERAIVLRDLMRGKAA